MAFVAGLELRLEIRFTKQDFDIFFASYAEELTERIAILLTDAVPKSLLAQRPVISLCVDKASPEIFRDFSPAPP